jgi:hypothetical protein
LEVCTILDKSQKIIEWYDGYNFVGTTILNPWSIINYMANGELKIYWANTSSNSLIRVMVENSQMFRKDLEILLNGGYIEKVIHSNIIFGVVFEGKRVWIREV